MTINEQIKREMEIAGFKGSLFAQFLTSGTEWQACQARPTTHPKWENRSGFGPTPAEAIAACLAAAWKDVEEPAK